MKLTLKYTSGGCTFEAFDGKVKHSNQDQKAELNVFQISPLQTPE